MKDSQSIYRDPPVLVRARFDASRHQNMTEYRLSRDLEEFEQAWEATRRKQMLAGMQPRRLPYLMPVLVILLALAAVFLAALIGVN